MDYELDNSTLAFKKAVEDIEVELLRFANYFANLKDEMENSNFSASWARVADIASVAEHLTSTNLNYE
jgi:hypothetical protein